ncbi:prolipoprotein diacylglyceryl transferase [Chloroflexota bacterium]
MIDININPVVFWAIRWYGVAVALAVTVLVLWLLWQVKKGARVSADNVFTMAIVGIPSGIIFARLLHVIDNIVIAKLHPELALNGTVIDYTQNLGQIIGGSGLTIYGAVLGATLGIWVYSRFSKLDFGYISDLIVPGLILAQVVGRTGCTINGCCYGSPTSLPWGIVYRHPDSLVGLQRGIAVHPTQVYEIIYLLIMFGASLLLKDRLRPDGSLFLVYLILYSAWRLGIGFLREGSPFLFGLHQAQFIGIVVLAIAIPFLIFRTCWLTKN